MSGAETAVHGAREVGLPVDQRIASAFEAACLMELDAPKPGNVHVHAPGHRMQVADFERSAAAAAPQVAQAGASVGQRVLAGMQATWAAVSTNTNLGILLLAAPLALASERIGAPAPLDRFRTTLDDVLSGTTVADADAVFAAIRLANPAGLGQSADQDVAAAATVTLTAAMALADEHDSIARQYVTTYADVVEIGLGTRSNAWKRGLSPALVTASIHLEFASRLPDSHVARKFGATVAEEIRREFADFGAIVTEADLPRLLQFDLELKRRGINPGTSADLTVATEMLARLLVDI